MSTNKNIEIVNPGDRRILTASLDYPKLQAPDYVTWKKKVYTEAEIKEKPSRLLYAIEDNGTPYSYSKDLFISYQFTKADIGKYIKFYSYVKEFNILAQCLVFYVEENLESHIRITKVERVGSEKDEIFVGGKLKLKVEYSVPENKVSSKTKENVRWLVKIGDRENILMQGDLIVKGGEIEIIIPNEWGDEEVVLMPYLNRPTPKVSISFTPAIKYPEDIKSWWSLTSDKNEIAKIDIVDIAQFNIEFPENIKDQEVDLELYYDQGDEKEQNAGISVKMKLLNGKGSTELDLVSELDRPSSNSKRNEALNTWKQMAILEGFDKLGAMVVSSLKKDPNIKLYYKLKYSKGEIYLTDKFLNVFFDEHIFNILDNHYRYSCHGGWIDKGHFNTSSPKRDSNIGAENLWRRIKNDQGNEAKNILRGDNRFVIIYRQDMGINIPKIGVTYQYVEKTYVIKKGLDIETKKRICMTIFQEVSKEFEKAQGIFASASSFEVSDLVSNMLGLYSVIYKGKSGYSQKEILEELKEVDTRTSLEIYLKKLDTFTDYKNEDFFPKYPPEVICPHEPKCVPKFPTKFQEIKPYETEIDKVGNKIYITNPKSIFIDRTLPLSPFAFDF